MGLDIVVLRAGLNRDDRSATVMAERIPNHEGVGMFYLDPANERLQKRWNELFGKKRVSLRSAFKTALDVIRKNHGTYMTRGEKIELPYGNITAYKVSVNPSLSVTFRHNGADAICDAVTVRMVSSAGNTYRFNIIAENAIPTFTQKALEYLKQEEVLQPVPVPMATIPMVRRPVRPVSESTLALNR